MDRLKRLSVFLLPSLVGINLLIGCASSNSDRASESTLNRKEVSSNLPQTREIKIQSPSVGTLNKKDINSNLPRTEEIPEEVDREQPETVYNQLVRQYSEDYKSCVESYRAKAKACDVDGVPGETTSKNLNVQLVLDASGSMANQIGGEQKLEIAKDALGNFVNRLPKQANVALRVYGHLGSNLEQDKEKSCAGTELIYNFQPLDRARFTSAIESLQPTGWTPIAASLDRAGTDFRNYNVTTNENVVYLVSDGIETCDGDPIAAAQKLNQSNVKAIVNVIGFDVDSQAAQQLRRIAEVGGGEYLEASTRDELWRIFQEKTGAAWSKYRCVNEEQWKAYRVTNQEQWTRYKCIHEKAWKEYNNIHKAAWTMYNNGELDRQTREYAIETARTKRDNLITEARTERDRTLNEVRTERDSSLNEARNERDEILEDARQERDEGLK